MRRGVEQLYAAFKEHGLTAEEFLSTKYLRLKQIKKLQAAELLDDTLRWVAPAR